MNVSTLIILVVVGWILWLLGFFESNGTGKPKPQTEWNVNCGASGCVRKIDITQPHINDGKQRYCNDVCYRRRSQ